MIESVTRALKLLEILSDMPAGATLTRLVNSLGMEKSAVSRILATLERDGYIVRESNGDVFKITLRFAGMALRHVERVGVIEASLPALQQLADDTGELVQLAVIGGDRVIYVAKAIGRQRIQAIPLIGTSAELHASSAGKLWLASLEEEKAVRLVLNAGLRKITDQTIVKISLLQEELVQVREAGYALSMRELSEDMNAIAVPIKHARTEQLVAALVVSAPAYRMNKKQLIALGIKAKTYAAQLREVLTVYPQDSSLQVVNPSLLPTVGV